MVEFALILPILLLLLFGILEYGRLFFAWISIENSARVGARYASTGEFDQSYCNSTDITDFPLANPDGLFCEGDGRSEEINQARILSIKDETHGLLFGNPIIQAATETQEAYFNVVVCSASANVIFTPPTMGDTTYSGCTDAIGANMEHPGEPGERVIISVDYNFPFIVPFFKDVQDFFHLASYKEATVEQFRVSRVVNLPPTHTVPTIPTNTPTPSITPSPTVTASPTSTPDCTLLYVENTEVRADDIRVIMRNDTGLEMPLSNSSLDWTQYVGEYVNYFQWNWRTYYTGNDYTPPTNDKICIGSDCSFPTNSSRTWRADFSPVLTVPGGVYTVDLEFGNFCNAQAVFDLPSPTPSPTPDCSLISVVSISTPVDRIDRVIVKVENENLVDVPLTSSTINWIAPSGVDWIQWSRNDDNTSWYTYYGGNDYTSPNNRDCNNTRCSFPATSTRDWVVDFRPDANSASGTSVELTFGNVCTVTADIIPELSCANMGIDDFYISGDNIEANVHNYNVVNMPLISSNLVWSNYNPPFPDQRVNNTRWTNVGYDGTDDTSSPTFRTCTGTLCDFPGGAALNWDTDFNNAYPLYGNYAVSLVFSNGDLTCTLNDSLFQGTPIPPTPTPIPDCSSVSAGSLQRSGDNIQMNITNDNFASGYLTSSSLTWEPYNIGSSNQYLDWVQLDGSTIYGGNHTGPVTSFSSNAEIPSGETYLWDADFDNPDAIYGSWSLNLVLDFDNGLSCPLSGTLGPLSTPVPQPTDIPSCSDLTAGVPYITDDDVKMHVTNNNDVDIQLTNTSFVWNNIDPSSFYVDEFILGSQYYSGDDNSSPTNTSNSATLSANSGEIWSVDFDGASAPMYGEFEIQLTFDVAGTSCSVSGSVNASPPVQSCNSISSGSLEVNASGDGIQLGVTNNNSLPIYLKSTHFVWDAQVPAQSVDFFSFNGSQYYGGNDASSPTDASSNVELASSDSDTWAADFTPDYDISGDFQVDLTFELNDGTTCPAVSKSGTISSGGGGFD